MSWLEFFVGVILQGFNQLQPLAYKVGLIDCVLTLLCFYLCFRLFLSVSTEAAQGFFTFFICCHISALQTTDLLISLSTFRFYLFVSAVWFLLSLSLFLSVCFSFSSQSACMFFKSFCLLLWSSIYLSSLFYLSISAFSLCCHPYSQS